jgi:tRNA(adenine34) deaminase
MSAINDSQFMELALQQARLAAADGEIPVGAVVVKDGVVVGVGRNHPIAANDPTAHAEIAALRSAAQHLGNYRLDDCTLYVTLEPCAMCSGAALHARLARVVFGATEPKTGAAGSILNLFQTPALNHQTQLLGGVLAEECAELLRVFFQERRAAQRQTLWPLREDALRTPEAVFAKIREFSNASHYVDDLPTLAGLRLHYADVGAPGSSLVFFCVHGHGAWSYQFQSLINAAPSGGFRVVAPDLIGFGKSDKPKRKSVHSPEFHIKILGELLDRLDLSAVVLVVTGTVGPWGLNLLSTAPGRIKGLLSCQEDTKSSASVAAFHAPFPDAGHQAALSGLPACMQVDADTLRILQEKWASPTLLLSLASAPLTGATAVQALLQAHARQPTDRQAVAHQPGVCTMDHTAVQLAFAGR